MVGKTKQRIKYSWHIIAAGILLILLLLWAPVIAPRLVKQDINQIIGISTAENVYDETTGIYGGNADLSSALTYRRTATDGKYTEFTGTFITKDASGNEVWHSQYPYKIDTATGEFDPSYSAKSRTGYIFGKPDSQRSSYTFWHPKYDFPIKMEFIEPETVQGVSAYRYRGEYTQNVTKQYREFGNYKGRDDIVAAGRLRLWIEPTTGNIMKATDDETLSYHDPATGKEISPWMRTSESTTLPQITTQVDKNHAYRAQLSSNYLILPAIITIFLIVFLCMITFDVFNKHKNLHIDGLTATMAVASIVMCLAELYGRWVLSPAALVVNYRSSISIPWAVTFALVFTVFAVAAVFVNIAKSWVKLLAAVPLIAIIVASALSIAGIGVDMPQTISACFVALGIAMLIAFANSKRIFNIYAFRILLGIVFALGAMSELFTPFRTSESAGLLWEQIIPTPLGASLAITAVVMFRISYENAHNTKKLLSMAMRVSVVVFAFAVILTGFLWRTTDTTVSTSGQRIFEEDTSRLTDMINQGIRSQAFALIGGASLFDASENVTRDEFNTFYASIRPLQNTPGLQCIGYAPVVTAGEVPAFEQGLRQANIPYNKIYPAQPSRSVYVPVDYVEPYNECKTAIGYDMLTSAVRRTAMEEARDTGEATMSGKIKLIIETTPKSQSGFQMYMPIYKKDAKFDTLEHRREGLTGYMLGPVRMNNFVEAVIGNSAPGIGIAIYDTDSQYKINSENKIYESNPGTDLSKSRFHRSKVNTAAGHSWLIKYGSLPGYTPSKTASYSLYTLVGGLSLSTLLALATYGLYGSRQRALGLAGKMTQSLRLERNKAISLQQEDDAILSGMVEGMVVIDKNGLVRRANESALKMFGYAEKEILNKHYSDAVKFQKGNKIVPPDDVIIARLMSAQTGATFDRILARKNGELMPIRLSISPIIVGKDTVGIVAIASDVSRQYDLDRAKDMFLSLATHQLKTPITALKWYTEMLLEDDDHTGKLPKLKRKIALSIKKCVKNVIYISDNLLNISRIETGRLKLGIVKTDIQALVRQVVEDYEPQSSVKKQTVICDCDKNIRTVDIDPQLMAQAFANLVNNAIKYSPDGSKIEVTVKQNSKEVIVAIKDYGLGIPRKQHAQVFNKFFRGENAVRREASGNGLGLYLVKAIVKANGGKITFVSEENKGSTFTVHLPRKQAKTVQKGMAIK